MELQQQASGLFIMNSHFSIIGVVQILEGIQPVDFALAIYFDEQLISLGKHFPQGRKPGRAYFRKQGLKGPLLNTFGINLGENSIKDYDEWKTRGKTQKVDEKGIFVKIQLTTNPQRQNPPLISSINFNYANYASGLAIGIENNEKELRLIAIPFDVNQIANLNLPISVGVLFFNKMSTKWRTQQMVYGFYDNLDNNEQGGEDYFLYQESLIAQANNQTFIAGNNVAQVISLKKHPYNSIGVLYIPGNYVGTASFLLSKDGKCKYIITCAHNFYNFQNAGTNKANQPIYQKQDLTSKDILHKYKIGIAKYTIPEQPGRHQIQIEPKFKIKQVHIPDEYKQYVDKIVQLRDFSDEKIGFPQVTYGEKSEPQENGIEVQRKTFWDIAVAELQEELQLNIGFRIKKEKPFDLIDKNKIEVTGFPRSEQKVKTIHGKMYSESTANHDVGYVRLSKGLAKEGWQVLKHKLSTLGGNSGSPIYERNGEESYLFGIHTAGVNDWVPSNQLPVWGTHNFGTYLYSQNIMKWLKGIEGIESVIQNGQ